MHSLITRQLKTVHVLHTPYTKPTCQALIPEISLRVGVLISEFLKRYKNPYIIPMKDSALSPGYSEKAAHIRKEAWNRVFAPLEPHPRQGASSVGCKRLVLCSKKKETP